MDKKSQKLKDSEKFTSPNKVNGRGQKEAKTQKEVKHGHFALNLAAMVGIIALLVVLTIVGLNVYTRHGQEIIVPNVKGASVNVAVRQLESLGLAATVEDSAYVKSMPPNTIYEQSIPAGSAVKSGRIIHLIVNSGSAPQLIIPDIADNSSQREAVMRLTTLGFKLGPTEYMKGEKDWVYEIKCNGHNIGAGSKVATDDEIVLVVGDGTYYDDDVEFQEGIITDSSSLSVDGQTSGSIE